MAAECDVWPPDFTERCSLARGHGGPHFAAGVWWERRDEPPVWRPPRYTVDVDLTTPDGDLHGTVRISTDSPTRLDMGPAFPYALTFRVERLADNPDSHPPDPTPGKLTGSPHPHFEFIDKTEDKP